MSTPIQPPEPVIAVLTHAAESGAKDSPQPAPTPAGAELAPHEAALSAAGIGAEGQAPYAAALLALLARIERQAGELSEAGRHTLLRLLVAVERRTWPLPPGRAWSLDPTRGDATRWPSVWAQCMPRWLAHGEALGLTHREDWMSDEIGGPRRDLIALGIVAEGDFPGDAGRGRSMVTFAEDGRPKRKGESNNQRKAAMRVFRRGTAFVVEVIAPRAVCNQRRRQEGLHVSDSDDEADAMSIALAVLRKHSLNCGRGNA